MKLSDRYIPKDLLRECPGYCPDTVPCESNNLQDRPDLFAYVQAIDEKDAYTAQHSINVACYAVAISWELKLSSLDIERIRHASLLHDIGKMDIPECILNKPTKLTPEEYEVIKKHPLRAAQILSNCDAYKPYIPGVRFHHERMDGLGYPDGLCGHHIPLDARIIAVADAFDAMTSDRPFRPKLPVGEAVRRLENGAGSQFDPEIVAVWIRIVERV